MRGDLCVDDDEQFVDVALPEVFTGPLLDHDEASAASAADALDTIYRLITRVWNELEVIERALRLSETTSTRARRTREWVREALGGLEYPVFRGLDEARCAMRHGQAIPPDEAELGYLFQTPSTTHHGTTHGPRVVANSDPAHRRTPTTTPHGDQGGRTQ